MLFHLNFCTGYLERNPCHDFATGGNKNQNCLTHEVPNQMVILKIGSLAVEENAIKFHISFQCTRNLYYYYYFM